MDLWIRSQDRKKLVKVDSNLTIDDTNSIFCDYDSHFIGSYKSQERALEVLDDIQDIMLNEVKGENHLTDIIYKHCNGIALYQMPKE